VQLLKGAKKKENTLRPSCRQKKKKKKYKEKHNSNGYGHIGWQNEIKTSLEKRNNQQSK
jgi:hypothetical protein